MCWYWPECRSHAIMLFEWFDTEMKKVYHKSQYFILTLRQSVVCIYCFCIPLTARSRTLLFRFVGFLSIIRLFLGFVPFYRLFNRLFWILLTSAPVTVWIRNCTVLTVSKHTHHCDIVSKCSAMFANFYAQIWIWSKYLSRCFKTHWCHQDRRSKQKLREAKKAQKQRHNNIVIFREH